jgi:ProP effector
MSSTNPAPSAETAATAPAAEAAPHGEHTNAHAGAIDTATAATEVAVPPALAAPVAADLTSAEPVEAQAVASEGTDPEPTLATEVAEAAADAAPARPQPSTAATAARLGELFPALFTGPPKPLKLRIQVDIQERAPGEFSKQALSAFFRRLTGATSYLMAVSRGKQRFDLDGQPAGELSEEHRQLAADELTRRRANQQARRAQEDAQREQEDAARRQRFNLLRDFETTKLTTANFCALKGIAPDALDGLLAQARAEAVADAARPRRPDASRPERGHHTQGRRDEAGGRSDDRGRPGNDARGPRGPGGHGGPRGAGGAGGPGSPSGRNDRRGPPRG